MAGWTFAVSRLEREGEGMLWSRTITNLRRSMAGPAGLFGLAFVAFRWTWSTLALGGVDREDAAAAAYDWLCRSGTGYGYLQKPAAAAMALRAACSGRINTR